jgi:glycerol-3-phosphate cytidylyltransferase-like family protein
MLQLPYPSRPNELKTKLLESSKSPELNNKLALYPGRTKRIIDKVKTSGGEVLMTLGSFDLLHSGHEAYFKAISQLKRKGDIFVVMPDSDFQVGVNKYPGARLTDTLLTRMQKITLNNNVDLVTPNYLNTYNRFWWISFYKPNAVVLSSTSGRFFLNQVSDYANSLLDSTGYSPEILIMDDAHNTCTFKDYLENKVNLSSAQSISSSSNRTGPTAIQIDLSKGFKNLAQGLLVNDPQQIEKFHNLLRNIQNSAQDQQPSALEQLKDLLIVFKLKNKNDLLSEYIAEIENCLGKLSYY